jgi:hypothetical protein
MSNQIESALFFIASGLFLICYAIMSAQETDKIARCLLILLILASAIFLFVKGIYFTRYVQ